ncbi:type II secretion system protein [Vibrio taketomensis]|uniref:type II secretion system protein n=1 Tax=Vibrio taketomensis TaxID=2572923 RepID=UPI001389EF9C|nr:type II secretion system protein [Vibrio taketomensis]
MKRQGGFTLIELVVVIVILGILAVTAAPRFLNLQDDARNASLEGLKGAMAGATGIVYGRAAIDGVEADPTGSVSDASGTVQTVYGYPKASDGIGQAVVGLNDANGDWKEVSGAEANSTLRVQVRKEATPTKCYVQYQMANTSGATPSITVEE